MSRPPTDSPPIPAVILAAGSSQRLGQPKQLLRLPLFHPDTLLEHSVRIAHDAGAFPVIVVLGAHADEIEHESQLPHCVVLRNAGWQEGMASSLRLGISAVTEQSPAASGALLMVCDQLAVTANYLSRLIVLHKENPERLAVSRYTGRTGVPIVAPRALFPALIRLTGDRGARAVFQHTKLGIQELDLPCGEWDVDLPEDMERYR